MPADRAISLKIAGRHKVEPGSSLELAKVDPDDTSGFPGGKSMAKDENEQIDSELGRLQELLHAENKHKLLVVLQAMDSGGKDGTIRRVFTGVNPAGVDVASFKAPDTVERAHDYLWRVHKVTLMSGDIMIFNRSYYEDVLVVRVHDEISEDECVRRYRQINDFERMLVEEGTTILKFFLHISRDEQRERLQDRLEDPTKQWKLSEADIHERAYWDEYMKAYEQALTATSTEAAPWYVVPANHRWYRDLVVASAIVETLASFKMEYPRLGTDPKAITLT